jgi:hypothetical protein
LKKLKMIDLQTITRAYLQDAISLSRREHQGDAPAVQAVHDRTQMGRQDALRKWLGSYRVTRFSGADRAAAAVLKFADDGGCDREVRLSYDELMSKFDTLHEQCRKLVHLNKDNAQRDLTSFTSKALWCCYPSSVPIYDNFTQSSVWIISRLSGVSLTMDHPPKHRYRPFASAWLAMYGQVASIINEADLQEYLYPVRVFDKVLWIVGEPNYNRDPSKVAQRGPRNPSVQQAGPRSRNPL